MAISSFPRAVSASELFSFRRFRKYHNVIFAFKLYEKTSLHPDEHASTLLTTKIKAFSLK